ncbi:hypothetical protein P280DRAFT_435797 [Massarina eburnea CBS 473.64]|uniref:Zn(2)-C6 fungal-type domain-containing protein n=1 Tax=Massarina eburnea CBS 473.64 TaxID=1395130 RepID=A0A6A6RLB7_9PLEO|nr:hypothetical protein P280DRAFT_435797 [Massarina eburnea CBS 473.64]
MFTTFSTGGRSTSSTTTAASSTNTRPKRAQVARACDTCRANRTKCDENAPCVNCKNRGVSCSNASRPLSNRLETKDSIVRSGLVSHLQTPPSEPVDESHKRRRQSSPPDTAAPSRAISISSAVSSRAISVSSAAPPHAISVSPATSLRVISRDAFSSAYYVDRVAGYLSTALGRTVSTSELQPISAATSFVSPVSLIPRGTPSDVAMYFSREPSTPLSRPHEEQFLNLYWQSYQCIFPIFDEDTFMQHYESLWVDSTTYRRACPLVDSTLALCMQYGTAFDCNFVSHSTGADVEAQDASVAGNHFFARCQDRLASDIETPTLATVQAQLLSAVYLINASFVKTALTTLASAVRVAHLIQLQHAAPDHLPPRERSLRKRVWWTLFALERQLSMELGQPCIIQLSTCSCEPPGTSLDVPTNTQMIVENEDINWLSFHQQWVKLVTISSAIKNSFFKKQSEVIGQSQRTIYEDAKVLESLASFLNINLRTIKSWRENVPTSLKGNWQGNADPFSTHRTAIRLNTSGPLWLQRQQVILVVRYHDMMMSLFRPFYRFSPGSTSTTPLSDTHNIACVNHAITITLILHHVSTETDILSGSYEACKIQWNAILTIIGFMLANPVCPPTSAARKTIQSAISVFSIFGANYNFAKSASEITRLMNEQVVQLIGKFWTSVNGRPTPNVSPISALGQSFPSSTERLLPDASTMDFLSQYDVATEVNDGTSSLPLTFDGFMSADGPWGNGDFVDQWTTLH